jgi:hypothetical protein
VTPNDRNMAVLTDKGRAVIVAQRSC